MKPTVGSVLPAEEKPARGNELPKFWIVPPVSVTTKNCWRNWAKARMLYSRVRSWMVSGSRMTARPPPRTALTLEVGYKIDQLTAVMFAPAPIAISSSPRLCTSTSEAIP